MLNPFQIISPFDTFFK